jgi:drug/metabolite transporter (DMT)-like permease
MVRFDRERSRGYCIGGCVLFFIGLTILAIGLDEASGGFYLGYRPSPAFIVRDLIGGVLAACIGVAGYKSGTAFSRAFVVIGPDGVRLRLVKKDFPFKLLPEQRFKWEEIGQIACGRGICNFRAGSQGYELNGFNSPSPTTVAQLMAERKGVQLSAQELLVPSGPKMPSLTKSAKMGGIGLALIGAVAAGGFWLYRHQNGPYYASEFLALAVLGFLGFFLVGLAIVFFIMELNHRF